jgi:hypothetical protein
MVGIPPPMARMVTFRPVLPSGRVGSGLESPSLIVVVEVVASTTPAAPAKLAPPPNASAEAPPNVA